VTLKLVAVEGEPVPAATLADELQDFTDTIEADAVGVVSIIMQADGSLRIVWHGQDYSSFELMGVFEAAKFRVIADDLTDD
jgi:hypothetical protein